MSIDYFTLVPKEIILLVAQKASARTARLFAQTSKSIASTINLNPELLNNKNFSPTCKKS